MPTAAARTPPIDRPSDFRADNDARILKAIADGPERALLALGYAGWAPGQLEQEIHANGWLNCNADTALVFDPELETKYDRAMRKLGIDLAKLSSVAGHA